MVNLEPIRDVTASAVIQAVAFRQKVLQGAGRGFKDRTGRTVSRGEHCRLPIALALALVLDVLAKSL